MTKFLRKKTKTLRIPKGKKKCIGNPYLTEVSNLKETIPHWDHFFGQDADNSRIDEWIRLEVL